jgi:ABC-type antimicrobial peptide transport system permease subunit
LSITAGILAAIGIYGVLAYAVAQRRREVGIRLALGAAPYNVRSLFLRQGVTVALAGIAAGLATGHILSRLASSLFFGVQPGDPLTLAASAALMLAVALLASLVPTLRAARASPSDVLRSD